MASSSGHRTMFYSAAAPYAATMGSLLPSACSFYRTPHLYRRSWHNTAALHCTRSINPAHCYRSCRTTGTALQWNG